MSLKGIGKAAVRVSTCIKSTCNGGNESVLILFLNRLRKHSNRSSTLCVLARAPYNNLLGKTEARTDRFLLARARIRKILCISMPSDAFRSLKRHDLQVLNFTSLN